MDLDKDGKISSTDMQKSLFNTLQNVKDTEEKYVKPYIEKISRFLATKKSLTFEQVYQKYLDDHNRIREHEFLQSLQEFNISIQGKESEYNLDQFWKYLSMSETYCEFSRLLQIYNEFRDRSVGKNLEEGYKLKVADKEELRKAYAIIRTRLKAKNRKLSYYFENDLE